MAAYSCLADIQIASKSQPDFKIMILEVRLFFWMVAGSNRPIVGICQGAWLILRIRMPEL